MNVIILLHLPRRQWHLELNAFGISSPPPLSQILAMHLTIEYEQITVMPVYRKIITVTVTITIDTVIAKISLLYSTGDSIV